MCLAGLLFDLDIVSRLPSHDVFVAVITNVDIHTCMLSQVQHGFFTADLTSNVFNYSKTYKIRRFVLAGLDLKSLPFEVDPTWKKHV